MSLLEFLLSLGATCRLTRFITKDTLAGGFRSWIADRFGDDSKPSYLVSCSWCTSIWVAAAMTALTQWAGGTVALQLTTTALSLSYLAGLASRWLD
ncbi:MULTISPECIES: hypothetical protein [Streptomyces]|uniref:hypothetical protein n=1 Tax=Streptomyces TaxID=1883 RepID=UPI0008847E26|nr:MULTISPECIES: hypothetical protein [Streptomyces]MCF3176898.1 hypothetical protein [Streptomyces sioyaensis]PBC82278.1 hypothetical protein BX261_2169 [Streptomyces sp. 2321.6]SDR50515.1 hypothetical protein SAMN05216511_5041 [Streptomyces sp. KS_16]SEC51116.1 hypothetical protein SAMN05428940_2170 [Streptomyces sp. 2133.1]SEE99548.1 hypothetical protein SAMN05428954_5097 [Streptomyces sp. 2112.3]